MKNKNRDRRYFFGRWPHRENKWYLSLFNLGGVSMKRAGFTLLEIMVVVVILGILATVLVTQIGGAVDKAKYEASKATLAKLQSAIGRFKLENKNNRYPDKLEELYNKPSDMQTWPAEGFASESDIVDAWGRDLIYKKPGTGGKPYDLLSYGADGKPGGKDYDADIDVWNLGKR